MKYLVLSFVFMLFFGISFSQNREETRSDVVKGKESGEIVKGKNVAYRVMKDDFFYNIKNVDIQDTLWYHFGGKLAPVKMRKQIREIVYKYVKMENLRLSREEFVADGSLVISFILNKEFKVEKIMFSLNHGEVFGEVGERDFWPTLPMDFYYKIEQEIMKMEPVIEEKDKKWINRMDFKNGEFLCLRVDYERVVEALNAKEPETKNNAID